MKPLIISIKIHFHYHLFQTIVLLLNHNASFIGLFIVILTIYATYFLFHKKGILKRFYHSTPESPKDDKKYYIALFIFMLALLFTINLITNILCLTVLSIMFLEWFGENWEHIEAKGK